MSGRLGIVGLALGVVAACSVGPTPAPTPSMTAAATTSPSPSATSPTDAASPTGTPVVAPSAWTVAPLPVEPADDGDPVGWLGGPSTVIAVDGGYLVVGATARGAAAWRSPDGLTWERAPHVPDLDGAGMTAVADTGAGVLAIGGDGDRAMAWTSRDGLAWTRVPASPAFTLEGSTGIPPAEGMLSIVTTYAVAAGADGRLLAIGSAVCEDCLDPLATGEVDPFAAPGGGGVAWRSPDGLHWQASRLPDAGGRWPGSVAWLGDRWVAVGGSSAFTSPDGIEWTSTTWEGTGLPDVAVQAGSVVAPALDAAGLGAWASADGVAWEPAGLIVDDPEIEFAWIASGSGVAVVVGERLEGPLGAWVSRDLQSWSALPAFPPGTSVRDVTVGGDRIVVVGTGGDRAPVWSGLVLELPTE